MKQGWEIKKLGEVATYVNGYAFKPEHWGETGMPIIRIQNLNNPNAEYNYCDADIPEKFVVENGDILISWSASLGVYEWNRGKAYLNQHIFKVVFNKVEINKYFLKYAVNAKLSEMLKDAHGATMKHIVKGDFDNTIIPYPPREEQERIVEELDCLSGVIERKREQLRELDALAQSIFYQMFGDPITNEKRWEVNIIGNLAEFYNGVAHEGSISEDGQYDVINSKFISTQGEIRKHCDSQIFPLMKNDIVMVMSDVPNGKALAKCYLIETSDKYTLNQRICAFRNYNCFKPIFLYYYLNRHPYYLRFDDGNGQTNLRKNDVLNCPVYIPPLALQQEFADKIEVIEKQKELIKKSISETETLFNARMDYYFN